MTNGIIKGTGDSRYLKSVANFLTLYPTYEVFAAAFSAGTLPIDLNGINPAGWTTVGTKLEKATLLTDALCTALGLATTATPTEALDKLRELDSGRARAEIASYVGTGRGGAAYPCQLTFSFPPKVVFVLGEDTSEGWYNLSVNGNTIVIPSLLPTSYTKSATGFYDDVSNRKTSYGKKSADGKTISWYNTSNVGYVTQYNMSGYTYYFLAIG